MLIFVIFYYYAKKALHKAFLAMLTYPKRVGLKRALSLFWFGWPAQSGWTNVTAGQHFFLAISDLARVPLSWTRLSNLFDRAENSNTRVRVGRGCCQCIGFAARQCGMNVSLFVNVWRLNIWKYHIETIIMFIIWKPYLSYSSGRWTRIINRQYNLNKDNVGHWLLHY